MPDIFTPDLAYTVVSLTVLVVVGVVAYARGYSNGYNVGYVEATTEKRHLQIRLAVQEHAHNVLGRTLSHDEAEAIALEFERWLKQWDEVF